MIGQLMKQGKAEEANQAKAEVAQMKEASKQLENEKATAENDLLALLYTIPNIPNEDVPEGKDANDNVVVKEGGHIPELPEDAMCHWDLCKKYNLIDFDLGVKSQEQVFPSTLARWHVSNVRLRLSSWKRLARVDTSRCNPRML